MSESEREIRRLIETGGPIPFRRFMDLALYHPGGGYYRGRVPDDYYTNAHLQPVFGRLIARRISRWRAELGNPADFTVVELGAGRGETARQIRAGLPGVRYVEVEKDSGRLPDPLVGVVFSNEFFDALPVDVVRDGRQQWVGLSDGRLAWVEGPACPRELADYLDRFAPSLAAGQTVEAGLEALRWMERIAESLERGFVLTIDYGYTAAQILPGRRFPNGSLMSYSRHQALEDALADPGQRDITAHVNFTALAEHGGALGLDPAPLQTQAEFLLSIGRDDQFQSALEAASEREAQRHRLQLKTLLYGMGETFRVLVQTRRPGQ